MLRVGPHSPIHLFVRFYMFYVFVFFFSISVFVYTLIHEFALRAFDLVFVFNLLFFLQETTARELVNKAVDEFAIQDYPG